MIGARGTLRDRSAFVTGGSSGIGLAAARQLAHGHRRIGLFARDPVKLGQAADAIRREVPGTEVRCYAVDVGDAAAVTRAVGLAVAEIGAPWRVILSAGMVELGETDTLSEAAHRRAMDVNYFGCLWAIRAVVPHMAHGSAIGIVGSAGGIIGIYGYAAYAPSKFALRGLADILRVELAGRGIGVTLCLPPDTETPMLVAEERQRSAVTARMAAGGRRMTADAVAVALLHGMDWGRFMVLPNRAIRLLWLCAPLLLPVVQWRQRRLLRRFGPQSAQVFTDDVDEHRQDAPNQKADRKDHEQG